MGQKAKTDGSGNIIVQIKGNGNSVSVGLAYLTLIPPINRRHEAKTEIDLLNPYTRAIDLIGREADMESLWQWLHSGNDISIRTITGRAGAGKTRIAIELIERLNAEGGWWAGFIPGREMQRFANAENLSSWGWNKPTFVVIDYAASLVQSLTVWLQELAQNPNRTKKPLRILLLEREADTERGWLNTITTVGQSAAGLPYLFDPLEPKKLDSLDSAEARRELLVAMLSKVSELAGGVQAKLPPETDERFAKQLAASTWKEPLYLMMAALLSTHSEIVTVLDLPRTDLVLQLAIHETDRIKKGAPSLAAENLRIHLAAFASLCGGLDSEDALAAAEQECKALKKHYPGGPGNLVNDVRNILPALDGGISPVLPDLLAEAMLLRAFRICSLSMKQQSEVILRAVDLVKPKSIVPFVVRTIQDFYSGTLPQPLHWIERLIAKGEIDNSDLLTEILSAMPEDTLALREKAVELTELVLSRAREIARNDLSTQKQADLALVMNDLAIRLIDVGRRDEAVRMEENAVRIYEDLASAGEIDVRPGLARALCNLTNLLGKVGRRDDALAAAKNAVYVYEQLARSHPRAFIPKLAMSISNLTGALSDVGKREDALESAELSVKIYLELADAFPDKYLPYVAMTLNNLAKMLSDVGRFHDALAKADEALPICEQLAFARPDAYMPSLAMVLNCRACMLSAVRRWEDSLSASSRAMLIYEELAAIHADAFMPELGSTLTNEIGPLVTLGRSAEALAVAERVHGIYENLSIANRDAFLHDMAMSSINWAGRLAEMDRAQEAIGIAEKAIEIYAELASSHPSAFLPMLANSQGVCAGILYQLRRFAEAVQSWEICIRTLRPFFEDMPGTWNGRMRHFCELYWQIVTQYGVEHDEALLSYVEVILGK